MANDYRVKGKNGSALFTLTAHRGEGMVLLGMDWKNGQPPSDFVGFAIQYMEPGGTKFFALKNRISFLKDDGSVRNESLSTFVAPIQKFRWVHFPRNAEMEGEFVYQVIPIFMNGLGELSSGELQEVRLVLAAETYPGQLNISFTRGFISSQAFVDRYDPDGKAMKKLLPAKADDGFKFKATYTPEWKRTQAYDWMGFEARRAVLAALDAAIADPTAEVRAVLYDLNLPEVVDRLVQVGARARVIIDDSAGHGKPHSAEAAAEQALKASAGAGNVKRHHMGGLQHNKMLVVKGDQATIAVGGSTNWSWRGIYVQANNAIAVQGDLAISPFWDAFEGYWASDDKKVFGASGSALWQDLQLDGIDGKVTFSPHSKENAVLEEIAEDILKAKSSVLFSLAFLHQMTGPIRQAIETLIQRNDVFMYGISDKKFGGVELMKPDGITAKVYASELSKNVPEPFKSEPSGGFGTRMHHKFVVIDFDRPSGRVYTGSYNFSDPADRKNGENLFLFRDQRIATAYALEGLRIFDHYHFRVAQRDSKKARTKLHLQRPPKAGESAWFEEDWTEPQKILDRELFS